LAFFGALAVHIVGTSLAREHAMISACTRNAYLLSTLMAATTSLATQVSHADDAPVSESPQTRRPTPAWSAAKAAVQDRERPPKLEVERRHASYTSELVGAYVAVPIVGFGFAALLSVATSTDLGFGQFLLGAILASTIPAIVHFANGEPRRGARAFALPAIFLGTALVVAIVTMSILKSLRDDPDESEDGAFAYASDAGIAGSIGGALGAFAWAIFDVLASRSQASTRAVARRRELAQIQVGVVPRTDGMTAMLAARF
jgi:hypothetical protein